MLLWFTPVAASPWLDDGPHARGWLYHEETFDSFGDTMPLSVRIDYPAVVDGDSAAAADVGAPYPLIVFEHAGGSWYDNYDYLFRRLATRGFIVISGCHDSCGSWGPWGSDEYLTKHADLFHAMIDLALRWDTIPGSVLEGRIDRDRLSLAGHSHGGGALLDALPAYRPANPLAPLAIRNTMMISPCPWLVAIDDYPTMYPSVPPLHVVYGARDRDGCVADGQAIGIYEVGQRPRHYAYVEGADHYAFTDAGSMGISTITRSEAQQAAVTAIVANYEYLLNGNTVALPYLRGEAPLLSGPPGRSYQFHDSERFVIDDFESELSVPSVAIAGIEGRAFVNGFLSDAFVDHAAGVALVRAQLQRIYPAKGVPPYSVIFYEDAILGPASAYADALAAEQAAGNIAAPLSTSSSATFADWLDNGLGEIIVSAHQGAPGAQPHDEPLRARLCAGARAVVSEWRNELAVGSASSQPALECLGTRFDGTQNFVQITPVSDLFDTVLEMYNPGWGRSTVGLATDNEIFATSELTVSAGEPQINALGLPVIATDLAVFDEATMYQPARTLYSPTGGLEVAWQSAPSAGFRQRLAPVSGSFDATGWQALSFRVAQLRGDPLNPVGGSKNMRIELVDAEDRRVGLWLADTVQGALPYPFAPGGFGPKTVFQSYRLPFIEFRAATPGLDLSRLVAVEFLLGVESAGRLVFDDIEFVSRACTGLPEAVQQAYGEVRPSATCGCDPRACLKSRTAR